MVFADTLKRWRERARAAKREVMAIWLAARDPRVPWYAKALAGVTAGYAFSPIDLIPDFIPVIGLLDDLLLVPLGIWLTVRLIPADVMADLRVQAARQEERRPGTNWIAASIIVTLWLALAIVALLFCARLLHLG